MAGNRQVTDAPSSLLQNQQSLITWLIGFWRKIGQVEEWSAVTFQNNWVNVGVSGETAGFYKDPFEIVRLKGEIDGGTTGTTAFTLPVGYRPAATLRISIPNTGSHYVEITAAGLVQPQNVGTSTIHLDGVSFRAEQ